MADGFVYGEIGPDNLIRVPWLPDAERAAPVLSDTYHLGGAASNVAALLADWGMNIRLSGNALGDDLSGELMLGFLKQIPGLDLSYLKIVPGASTPFCRIMIPPNGDRVVLFYNAGQASAVPMTAEMLSGCRICVLDDNGGDERLSAAQVASQAGIPLVCGDIYRMDHPLLPYANIIVNSAQLIQSKTPGVDVRSQTRSLHSEAGAAIITSDGSNPVHIIRQDGCEFLVSPPRVKIVDATGAGDALKAGICYGLLAGMDLEAAVRLGVAAGSLVVQQEGATTQPPSIMEIGELSRKLKVTYDG